MRSAEKHTFESILIIVLYWENVSHKQYKSDYTIAFEKMKHYNKLTAIMHPHMLHVFVSLMFVYMNTMLNKISHI